MFLGEYEHTVDAKGRVALPKRFRDDVTGKLVASKGLEGCIYVYRAEDHAPALTSLLEGADFDPEKRKVRRFFTSGATEVELDKAGRVMLSAVLREHAGIAKDVTVIGNGERIEVWDREKWRAYNADMDSSIEESAAELVAKGLL